MLRERIHLLPVDLLHAGGRATEGADSGTEPATDDRPADAVETEPADERGDTADRGGAESEARGAGATALNPARHPLVDAHDVAPGERSRCVERIEPAAV